MKRDINFDHSIQRQAAQARVDAEADPDVRVTAFMTAMQAGAVFPPEEMHEALYEAGKAHNWYSKAKAIGDKAGLGYVLAGSQLGDARASVELARLCADNLDTDFPQAQAENFLKLAQQQARRPSREYRDAARGLAEAYEKGIGAERDDAASFLWWATYGATVHWEHMAHAGAAENAAPPAWYARVMGDISFDDAGRNFEFAEDAWGVARIWWKKTTDAAQPYDPRILTKHLPPDGFGDDADIAHAIERLGYLSHHGLGVTQSTATAFCYWRRAARIDRDARQSAIHLLERRVHQVPTRDVNRQPLGTDRMERIRAIRRRQVEAFKRSFPVTGDDNAAAWLRHQESPSETLADRLEVYRKLATQFDTNGAIALALARTLFDGFDPRDGELIRTASERTKRVPAPIARLYERPDAVKRVSAALRPILDQLPKETEAWSSSAEVPKYLIDAVLDDRLEPSLPTLQWCDLRLYLAQIAGEPSERWWKELNSRLQARSEMLADWLQHYEGRSGSLKRMTASIERSTLDYGPLLNELDANGFPIPRARATRPRSWFPGLRVAAGWDSVDAIVLTEDGFEVIGETTEKGVVPIVTAEDLEEVLAIALLEVNERRPGPDESIDDSIAFSLEFLADEHLAPVRLRFYRREVKGAQWINMTGFGRAKYYTDCLIFIDEAGGSIVSAHDSYRTRATHQDGWQQPQPWRRAKFGGGISASPVGRNAGVTAHGEGADNPPRSQTLPYRINLPRVLRHLDGSEMVYNADGSEKHRDGGRNSLHYWPVRHASILSGEIPLMAEQFPVYQRTMQLEKVYSGLRMDLGGDVTWLRDSKLFRRLEKVRWKAINAWRKDGQSAGVVVAH